ncbi:MAG: penicillin-binding protein activator [Gammaproteobacteria bacterium]
MALFGCAGQLPRPAPPRAEPAAPADRERVRGEPAAMPPYVESWLRQAPAERGGIALLLPLSGSFAGTAQAVRDGFLARHFEARSAEPVRVYDVGDGPEHLLAAYQRALNDGAGFIVGPLRKEGVVQLASMSPPVPVVGLNYVDSGVYVPFNFYQLGLAPEDEARAAADDAGSRGLRRAVALVPEGDWGARVLAALDERLRQWGGAVVSEARYRQGVSDQSDAIAALMGVAASEERHRELTGVLGVRTQFEARRRSDIDFVFLGARSADARVLLPQLRFYRATGLPHYATSLVYDGRPDRELAGLRFCDMPFMLDAAGDWAQQRALATQLSAVASYPRLYALGRDAYQLATSLQSGRLRVGDALDGASGRLEWAGSSALLRRLDCVEMQADGLVPTFQPAYSGP